MFRTQQGREVRTPWRRRTAAVAAALLLVGMVAGCGENGDDGGQPTTASGGTSTPTTDGTSPSTDTGGPVDSGGPTVTDSPGTDAPGTSGAATSSTGPAPGLVSDPVAVDPAWPRYEETWFVWGVEEDDVLNARADAGASQRLVATFAPDARGIVVFAVGKLMGDEAWGPVEVADGAAWVNARYLRPEGPATPEVRGTADPAVADAAAAVVDALRSLDLTTLAALAHPDGVRVSPHAFVADTSVLLTPAAIAGGGSASEELLWGYTDGEGAPIRRTVLEQLRAVAGSTALTSTSVIGYGDRVHSSNSIDNIDDVFPGAARVEYHFSGTSLYPEYDWASVRLVFDTDGASPLLVAIVEDTWTI